jgi:hypothetical protein
MKKFFSFLLAACLLSTGTIVNAQQTYHRCFSAEHLQSQLAADPSLAEKMQAIEQQSTEYAQSSHSGSRAVITIPVVVHVVYNTAAQNISDALIQAQINQLNLDFAKLNSDASNVPSAFAGLAANTNVQFCLAQRDPSGNPTTGIVRKATTVTSFSTNDGVKKTSTGGAAAWDATKYLNLWVCNLGGGILGYAQFPGGAAATDGVVVLYSSVGSLTTPGTSAPYNYGRTATHEVGHWLNLYHIWGDDGTACTGSDNVADTPNQADENYGCPTFPTVSCSNGANGDMFMNYMDYTDDACMNMFTTGQATRMNALFATGGVRVGLAASLGCQPVVVVGCGVPSGSTAGITTTAATLSWGAVTNAVSYNYQWRAVGAATWNTGSTASTSVALSGLTQATNYEWQVQTVCSAESSAFSSLISFTTATPSTCTDIYESNNTSSAAKTPVLNTNLTGFITPSTDVDWFKFTTTTAGGTRVKVDLTNLPADYDVVLYKSNASTKLATGSNGGTTSESVKYNTTSRGTYYVKVYGYNGATSATSCYTLRISTSTSNFRTDETNADETILEVVAQPVLKLYPNPASNKLNVEYLSTTAGLATLSVYNLSGQRVMFTQAETTEGMNIQSINTDALSNGVYIFEIYSNGETQRQKFTIAK